MRRTELLAVYLMSQLDQGLRKAPCISLAIDESTDSTDNAQLIVFVRYYDAGEKKFCQDLLGVTDLKGRARGEDIYGSLKSMLESRNIDVKSIISVTTDGAPAMVGRERRLFARLKEDNPDMISYHSIIHQSVLCASLGDEYFAAVHSKPFLVTDITEFSVEANLTWKWVDAAKIQLKLFDFQENVALKKVFCDCTPETFWSKEGSLANFLTLHRLAVQILTMFGSTYCCESAFSTVNLVKNNFRSCMTNEHLHHCLRLAITPLVPKFRELAKSKKCNFSH
ncbi:zinc finger BED domain-containing protein 5-like [Palaemon carinicauda]|uniref:zinc finger BED domain-containing protein 5-like n=1 Tax=Palaemon carinicauda TaxID=392227 RepID=UPI0035B5743B